MRLHSDGSTPNNNSIITYQRHADYLDFHFVGHAAKVEGELIQMGLVEFFLRWPENVMSLAVKLGPIFSGFRSKFLPVRIDTSFVGNQRLLFLPIDREANEGPHLAECCSIMLDLSFEWRHPKLGSEVQQEKHIYSQASHQLVSYLLTFQSLHHVNLHRVACMRHCNERCEDYICVGTNFMVILLTNRDGHHLIGLKAKYMCFLAQSFDLLWFDRPIAIFENSFWCTSRKFEGQNIISLSDWHPTPSFLPINWLFLLKAELRTQLAYWFYSDVIILLLFPITLWCTAWCFAKRKLFFHVIFKLRKKVISIF